MTSYICMTIDAKMGGAKRDVSKQNRPKPVGAGSRGQSTVACSYL